MNSDTEHNREQVRTKKHGHDMKPGFQPFTKLNFKNLVQYLQPNSWYLTETLFYMFSSGDLDMA